MDCFFCFPTYHRRIVDYFGCSCHFGFFFAMNSSFIFDFLIHFTFSKLWSIVTCMLTKRHDLLSTMYLLAYFFFSSCGNFHHHTDLPFRFAFFAFRSAATKKGSHISSWMCLKGFMFTFPPPGNWFPPPPPLLKFPSQESRVKESCEDDKVSGQVKLN